MKTGARLHHDHDVDLRGVRDPDFLAIGLGGTNMMAMLWSLALGRRSVGVEMRGDPFLGVHWNIRADLYHQLGLIDRMMIERYGEAGVPRRANGEIFRLADCFYGKDTVAGDIVADEIIDGFDVDQHIVGTIHHVEFIDDRWRDGLPHRFVTLLQPPPPPPEPAPELIRTDMIAVLDGPSTFQAGAASILVLLRRYLEGVEAMDLEADLAQPRVRLFSRHRVVPGDNEGFIRRDDGRLAVRIESLQELDFRGRFLRVRTPGTEPIDLGVPELFVIAEGFDSADAARLGFEQRDVAVDHGDGRGPVVAQADFLAGLIEVLVGGRLRRRICSEFDDDGKEYWARQIAVGHENDPEVGWVLIQVPDFKTFDPVEEGLIGADADPDSPEFFAAYQQLVYEYYIEQASNILELPRAELKKVQMVYGPKLFSLIERMGEDARVGANGVVAGDSFGNGHFLTSGGAMTGMVGHSAAVMRYWQARDAGQDPRNAREKLAEDIKTGTEGWLHVSAQEYSQAAPINFGAERIREIAAASGVAADARAHSIDATRRKRHSLLPLDPSDWRRLFLRNGRVLSAPLPELHAMHPALRSQRPSKRGAKIVVAFVAATVDADTIRLTDALLRQPGARIAFISADGADALPEFVRARLAAHVQIPRLRDANQIVDAVRGLAQTLGPVQVLLGAPDLGVAIAEAREALRIRGMSAANARAFADPDHVANVLRDLGCAPTAADDGDVDERLSLEIMTIDGAPAWFSSTRARRRPETGAWTLTLPRDADDPADAFTRRASFAALRKLGMDTGMCSIDWRRRADGSTLIKSVRPHPPDAEIVRLMALASDADIDRAWANAVVNGLCAPAPRSYSAGAILFAETDRPIVEVRGIAQIQRDLAGLLVETHGADANGSAPALFVRHGDTRTVDQALEHLSATIRLDYA